MRIIHLAFYPEPFQGFYCHVIIPGACLFLCITTLYSHSVNGTVCPACSAAHPKKLQVNTFRAFILATFCVSNHRAHMAETI